MKSFKSNPKWEYYFRKDNYRFFCLPHFDKSYSLSIPMWKDKFGAPICERVPWFTIEWLSFEWRGEKGTDELWERWLWINKYNGGDENKAKKEWVWIDFETQESTWFDIN